MHRTMKTGFVYVLTNPGLPQAVKIGQTTRSADTRAGELRRSYGTVHPFAVASKHAVADPAAVEALAHLRLRRCRVPRSELFHCDVATAQTAILWAAARTLDRPWWLRLWHGLTLPRKPVNRYNRRRRGSYDGLFILAVLIAVTLPVILFKPPLPGWLPGPVLTVAGMLERLR
jgi:hypothetical protein